jgi:CubicO group peptidase (beta-lactamase class C family)
MTVEVTGECEPRFAAGTRRASPRTSRATATWARHAPSTIAAGSSWTCGAASPIARGPGRGTRDTLALVFSTTKGLAATCILQLVERGLLDLDAPIARYWPEFAANGKGDIPVRWAMCHKTGLAAVEGTFTLDQIFAWDPVVAAIAAQKPNWEPGTQHGYHARSYGWITGELVRRVTGRSFGRYFADEIAEPLGLELWVGLPESLEPRVAALIPAPEPADPAVREAMARFMGPETLLGKVLSGPSNLFAYDERWNRREFHAAEMPSSNGIGTGAIARPLLRALAGEVDGIRLLRPETIPLARTPQVDGPDAVIMIPTRFGVGLHAAAGAVARRVATRRSAIRRRRLARLRRSRGGARVRLRHEPDAARHDGRSALAGARRSGLHLV